MNYSETLKDKKYDPISSKEEFDLARRIKNGDQKAINRLVCANLRFVILVAIRYSTSGIPLQDLIQEGNVGIIEAAKRFDEKKNFKFISYAVWWIRHHILNLIHDTSRVVRVPPAAAYLSSKISGAVEKLQQRYGREPTNKEIALELHTTERWVEVLMGTNETTYLNTPVMKNSEVIDFLEDKTENEQ
ncbi:MAG: sigma-70 family RNA polymerase sigma factor, partial [Thermoplasmata archaeon]|nr:sigma-70 family RNA polymerase sigma factor [Thermoplasmata archaeon]